MAETNALLKRHTGNRIEGSNPSVSANTVVLDLGGGRHAFYEHLAPGSVRVAKGDRVTRGQMLAQVGLTGQGSEPHLHFHVADAPDHLAAEGLPYRLDGARLVGRYGAPDRFFARGAWQPLRRGRPVHGLPAPVSVVSFPDAARRAGS